MSLRTLLSPPISAWLLSEQRQASMRLRAERRRQAQGRNHEAMAFIQVDDPYSVLLAQVLPRLHERFDVNFSVHLVPAPADAVAPERRLLAAYARRDAAELARLHGLHFEDGGRTPDAHQCSQALRHLWLAKPSQANQPALTQTVAALNALWSTPQAYDSVPEMGADLPPELTAHMHAAQALRQHLGHYQGAMLYYEGEWYWGIDRLHHLERRLIALGASRAGQNPLAPLFSPPADLDQAVNVPHPSTVDFFFSLRSPYSAIAAPRVTALARYTGATVRWRYVLPMVMRGLPVPAAKRRYIAADAAREARWWGIPFGRINDPLGRPTERGLALMPLAEREGRVAEYVNAFMHAVWAQGINAGSDKGLRRITQAAGLNWPEAVTALDDNAWRATAEANRQALSNLGLWGVPSLSVGALNVWGQDRLHWIQDALLNPTTTPR